jgi:hypothetical protein
MKNLLLLVLLALAYSYANAQCGSPDYTEPEFTIAVQNPACPLVSEIKVITASGGVGPYTYTLMPANITNTTGTFTNIAPGNYIVQMRDACGTIRSRQATITPYNFTTSSTYTSLGCSNFSFTVTCSATGPALQYGYSVNGAPTTWGDSAIMNLNLDLPANITLYVKDSCDNQAGSSHYISEELGGYIKELQERIECSWQEIYPVYYGFNAPNVCLYRSPQNTLVECKQAPANYTGGALTNFFNLPFGQDYYVIVEDGCYRDSAFFKDKTSAGGVELNPYNWKCNTFDLHADGNNSGIVCLYNSANDSLIACKPTNDTAINPKTGLPWPYGGAEFYDLPYGTYYSFIYDPCADTLIRIDTTVTYPRNFTTQLNYHCSVVESGIGSGFGPESPMPHKTTIFYPDGTLAGNYINEYYLLYPTWPLPGTFTVIQEDGCGHKDTSLIHQPALLPTRTVTYTGGCPGINGSSGGGDILLAGNAYAYAGIRPDGQQTIMPLATVRIIEKDNQAVNIPQTYTQWNNTTQQQEYYFTNLSTGVYILESTIGCYGYKLYDTIEVRPYVYPLQEQTHITQCGTNPYVFRDTITGGVAPFTYQMIDTNPVLSSLLNGPQSSNIFSIPPGTNLNTITIQVVDACGNSNTKVYPVNHSPSCVTLPGDSLINHPSQPQNKPIKIYPNPSGKQFIIAFSQKKRTDYEVEIYNTAGIKLFSRTLKDIDVKDIVINEALRAGVYIINIRDLKNNRQYYHKQVVL